MLLELIKKIIFKEKKIPEENNFEILERANSLQESGELREALALFEKYLTSSRYDIQALNNMACCLNDLGDEQRAGELFKQVYKLDDTFAPGVVNYARYLKETKQSDESLKYLKKIAAMEADNPQVYLNFASIAFSNGNPEEAQRYELESWLGLFDQLRPVNNYLLHSSYIDEEVLASEHKFWAETLKDQHAQLEIDKNDEDSFRNNPQYVELPTKSEKIRVAYWSPDFRNHSVAFFAQPLIENHDKEKFEIIGYYDHFFHDDFTKRVEKSCDYFIPINEMPNRDLVRMFREHDLDILVELAGHSSVNRLNLLQMRLAKVQVSGLGYPPTTGLSSIDAKFLDIHISTEKDARFYAEKPLILKNSFWCFDPKVFPSINFQPPSERNGFITFGCPGNISKITDRMLKSWREILNKVPGSQLLVRSISFEDESALRNMSDRFYKLDFDLDRVQFKEPVPRDEFFTSYNDIDIVLDTFPFNGGTTTCFATYMGVPVISLSGKSLLSRMGKSILTNLKLTECVVSNFDEYVQKAVSCADNIQFLRDFRKEARSRYQESALGNGKLFAKDVEEAYLTLLDDRHSDYLSGIPDLPGRELIRRAKVVLGYNNDEAAARIVDYCLRVEPGLGQAHILWTQRITRQGLYKEAADYLEKKLPLIKEDRFEVLQHILRFKVLSGEGGNLEPSLKLLKETANDSFRERFLSKVIFNAHYSSVQKEFSEEAATEHPGIEKSLALIIVCEEEERFEQIKDNFTQQVSVDGFCLKVFHVSYKNRIGIYKKVLTNPDFDIALIVHKSISVINQAFYSDIVDALSKADVVSFGGAVKWNRLDWSDSPAENKVSSVILPSNEVQGFYDLIVAGISDREMCSGFGVLDGNLLALNCKSLINLDIDKILNYELVDGGVFLEQYLTYSLAELGCCLGVHQSLGVVYDWRIPWSLEFLSDTRLYLTELLSFDPLVDEVKDTSVISFPFPSMDKAFKISKSIFTKHSK